MRSSHPRSSARRRREDLPRPDRPFDGDDIVAILLKQPRTAELVVEKLWREFVSLKPDPAEVKRLAGILRNGNYEMKPVLRAMFLSPAFREPSTAAR